ncbi:MAG TPA: GTP cyclohydrolase FolE2 [Casimicrobiaceae bacterium]|nr:GTP cyclohydrolase FolE2 [Casimicrobiaceae bacterium]
MNRPEPLPNVMPMPDVQSATDHRELAIDRVGIRGLRYPLPIADRDGVQTTIAQCSVFVALPADRKGTHMSRLVALLEERAAAGATPIGVRELRSLVDTLMQRLDAPGGCIEIAFPFFLRKLAPVSGIASLLDYEALLIGELDDDRYAQTIGVAVPVTSLCPSSKEISAYGAHNQRSVITIRARTKEPVYLADLVRVAEAEASSELFGILKRADEKYVTEHAYDNPRFVEDMVRGVAARLDADARLEGFVVEAENFESIHNHSAYARIARGL